MEITGVEIEPVNDPRRKLLAFCTIIIDRELVIHDIKLIQGLGGLFVAMPSRKLTDHCQGCGAKNHLQARYCNECGAGLADSRAVMENKKPLLHKDIAHPLSSACRKKIQDAVINAYQQETAPAT